jgi:pimeloyl-ACP methyl ester carboxylesterase
VNRLETRTLAPAPGERIELDVLAGTSPCYLFLHGLGSARTGEKSTALLAHARSKGRAFCRFDFRGHGGSSGRLGHSTISELIDDGSTVLELIGPSILFGSSLGGLVSAFLAARHPELVRGLVLLSPAFGFLHRMDRRLDAQGRMFTSEGTGFRVEPRVLADAAALDEASLPRRIQAPLLLVHGTADDVVPPQLSERFFAEVPHDRKAFWLVPDGDHRLNKEVGEVLTRMDALLEPDRSQR